MNKNDYYLIRTIGKTLKELMDEMPEADVLEFIDRDGIEIEGEIPDDTKTVSIRHIDAGFYEVVLDI